MEILLSQHYAEALPELLQLLHVLSGGFVAGVGEHWKGS